MISDESPSDPSSPFVVSIRRTANLTLSAKFSESEKFA
jgi:hypothetical protein